VALWIPDSWLIWLIWSLNRDLSGPSPAMPSSNAGTAEALAASPRGEDGEGTAREPQEDTAPSTLEGVAAELAEVRSANDALEAELAEARSAVEGLEAELADVRSAKDTLEAELAAVREARQRGMSVDEEPTMGDATK
jgi:septal ring factor EnvC (AmiA/AmiB activator)